MVPQEAEASHADQRGSSSTASGAHLERSGRSDQPADRGSALDSGLIAAEGSRLYLRLVRVSGTVSSWIS